MLPLSLIVADRDARLVEQLAKHFRVAGCEVKTAYDALTALKLMHLETPDAACLGMEMTCRNGRSMCELLADERRFAFLPIVFLTDAWRELTARQNRDLRACCVTKGDDLAERVAAALHTIGSREEPALVE